MIRQRVIICSLLCYFALPNTSQESQRNVTVEEIPNVYPTCSNVNLTCRIYPEEDMKPIFWYLNETNVTLGDRIKQDLSKLAKSSLFSVLHINCAQETDSGNYSCRLFDNNEFSSSNSVAVRVRESVKVVNASEIVEVASGAGVTAELNCEFSGEAEINVTWSKKDDENLLSLPSSKQKLPNGRLLSKLILRDIKDKNGTYVCNGSDEYFFATKEVSLFVLSAPQLKLDKVFAIGAHSVFMNWTINDGNRPIIQYYVQIKPTKSDADWTYYTDEVIPKNETQHVFNNLKSHTEYLFKIRAENAINNGSGVDVTIDKPVTTFEYDPVAVPVAIIKGIGPHSINIGWNISYNELRSPVHFYKLSMRNKDKDTNMETIVDNDYNYAFTNLESATKYYFQVAVCNRYANKCGDWSKEIDATTLDGEAGPPQNVSVICRYDNISHTSTVFASWSPPKNPNGEIDHYNVVIQGSANYLDENGNGRNVTYGPKSKSIKNDTTNASFDNLYANTNYTISVSAVTRSRGSGIEAKQDCVMQPTIPDKEELAKFNWDKIEDKGRWYFRLLKPKLSERNGEICCFRVCVVKLKPNENLEQLPTPDRIKFSTYESVRSNEGGTYIADIFDKSAIEKDIFLGDERVSVNLTQSKCNKCPFITPKSSEPKETTTVTTNTVDSTKLIPNAYSNYGNEKFTADLKGRDESFPYDGALEENSNYTGFILLIVAGKNEYIPAYSSYFKVLQPGPQPLDESEATQFAAILFEILCGMIFISIMMLAAFCLLQHYTKQVAEAQGVEMTLRNSFRYWCRSLRGSHLPVSSNPPDVLPISKTALLTTFAELAKDSDYGFEQEFEMLPDRLPDRTTKASEARENAGKNRYPDIKAYDQTRVKLSQVDGIIGSDYINANFVVSYKERKKFICAQGPMENTVCDFWRMIWEQHLEIVLMLTNLEEYSKTKCAKYWPDKEEEKKTYADITIHYVNEKRYSDYVVRELKMIRVTSQNRDPEERSIFQYHFLMWKDFQAPEHPSAILKFIRRVNEAYSLEKGPILVHCSAGVGRTGTLVAIDSLLQQLDSEGQVLIFNTIYDLRRQRNFLVQSLKQYIFVYRALVEYAQFGNTEIKAKNLKATIEKLKQSDNSKIKSRMEEEFEKLPFTISHQDHKSSSVGTAAENAPKNRSTVIIPYDRNRVILTPIPGREHSTYINASFIEGYDNSESFIITQDPILDVTVVDFWRMISEQNISTIVMLSSTSSDGQKKTGRYWPDDETVHGNINVKHIQSESCPYYTRREFYVTNLKTDDNLVVTQYQYNGWPTVEGEVPEVTRGMIELMDHATQHASTTASGPIVVHCELGSDRSSMFVALSILAQQLKIERRVDVVTTARKLRSQRQGMLTTFAQYEFLYRAILNYVDLHHLSDSDSE